MPADWDRQAARYGAQEHLEVAPVAAALRLARVRPRDRVVDLATGTGVVLRALAAGTPRPARAVGVDSSAGMLAQVGALPDGFALLEADAADTGLPDGTADLVTCGYLLQLVGPEERLAVAREARRLLAPGGRVVVITTWADRRRPGGWVVHHVLAGIAAAAPVGLGGLRPVDPTDALERAGLRVVRRLEHPRGGYPSLALLAVPR